MSEPRIALAAAHNSADCDPAALASRALAAHAAWYECPFVTSADSIAVPPRLPSETRSADSSADVPQAIAIADAAGWPRALCGPDGLAERHLIESAEGLVRAAAQAEVDFAVLLLPRGSARPSQLGLMYSIEEQRHLLRRVLLAARFHAELAGVRLAIAVGPVSPLCDPLAARDFLDDLATPWIGAYIEASAPVAVDWQRILTVRTLAVHSQHDAGVAAALNELGANGAYLAIDGA